MARARVQRGTGATNMGPRSLCEADVGATMSSLNRERVNAVTVARSWKHYAGALPADRMCDPGIAIAGYGKHVIVACDAWPWRKTVMKRMLGSLPGMLLLAACAQTPMGPTVPVMPGPNTSFSQFQNDQAVCRNFADQAVRDQAQGANLRGLGTAALTTALGAGLGAAIGGGQGAGIGAAAGALGGTALAARNTSNANTSIQAQYNNAFASCMFSLGNSVPSMGPMINR